MYINHVEFEVNSFNMFPEKLKNVFIAAAVSGKAVAELDQKQ